MGRVIDAVVVPPGSKSLTNRAILIAAMATGISVLRGCLDSDDTRVMIRAIQTLGAGVSIFPDSAETGNLTVTIRGGLSQSFPQEVAGITEIDVAASGTTMRFLAAVLPFIVSHTSCCRIFGVPRMHERPIAPLLTALTGWCTSACVVSEANNGCPPVLITPAEFSFNSALKTTVAGDVSSQFLSGLLMAMPQVAARSGRSVAVQVDGVLVSQPYVAMTLAVMQSFGVTVSATENSSALPLLFSVDAAAQYCGADYIIEPDASAASYFFAASAICGGRVTVRGLGRDSLQGDTAFVDALEKMGCHVAWARDTITVCRDPAEPLRGITVDMNAISDTAQTLAVVALFADSPTTITGVPHIRHKETDRLAAVCCELRKLGAEVVEFHDGLTITPPDKIRPAAIATYDDHRMAMSFALTRLVEPGVTILNPECCRKTFPQFFDVLATVAPWVT